MQRMALAYCPRRARLATLALLALDTRFASLLRNSREPMLAQMRLAWWRETLSGDPARWPSGDPLLSALRSWDGHLRALAVLADGWEAMTGAAPLPLAAMLQFAAARGEAFARLCVVLGHEDERQTAARRAQAWAIADVVSRLSNPVEKQAAIGLLGEQDWGRGGLSRAMRPLAVLHGMAARNAWRGKDAREVGPLALLAAVRLGLLGR